MELLTPQQVESAMAAITANWATQPLADSVRDTWRRKLSTLRQGEFQPALDTWLDRERSRFRPDPGEFMEVVRERRIAAAREARAQEDAKALAEQRAYQRPNPDRIAAGMAMLRSAWRPEAKAAS